MNATDDREELLKLTTDIVASFTGNNSIAAADLPALISGVFVALRGASTDEPDQKEAPVPAVPVKKSVRPDYIVCLEDGKKLKVLKRHLAARYNLTPDQYRQRWGLSREYPMVAPAYAAQRSAMAKKIGLGRKPVAAPPAKMAPAAAKASPRRAGGGKEKAA
jgi:predicted transcriptional regulator